MEQMRFVVDIPKELHKEFKRACLDADITMKEKVIELLKKFVKESKKHSEK